MTTKKDKSDLNNIVYVILFMLWIMGFVIAKGFWETLFAFFPPFAYYLDIQHFMIMFKLL